jgi:hypothetical protein
MWSGKSFRALLTSLETRQTQLNDFANSPHGRLIGRIRHRQTLKDKLKPYLQIVEWRE